MLFYWLVAKSCLTLCDPMDCSLPGSSGFPRQKYWSQLAFPTPGDLPNPGIKPMSPALAGEIFTTEPPGKPLYIFKWLLFIYFLATVHRMQNFPDQGSNLCPFQWKHRVLATGPPGRSKIVYYSGMLTGNI